MFWSKALSRADGIYTTQRTVLDATSRMVSMCASSPEISLTRLVMKFWQSPTELNTHISNSTLQLAYIEGIHVYLPILVLKIISGRSALIGFGNYPGPTSMLVLPECSKSRQGHSFKHRASIENWEERKSSLVTYQSRGSATNVPRFPHFQLHYISDLVWHQSWKCHAK